MRDIYRFADVNFEIDFNYPQTAINMQDYILSKQADNGFKTEKTCKESQEKTCSIIVTRQEVQNEYNKYKAYPVYYYENVCILRKINEILIKDYNGFVFHSSTISYNNKAYAFTAHSGVGKSTHTGILKSLYGDKITYVNDDKPFIRYFEKENKFYVYGNAWRGKHNLGNNVKAELGAICFLERNSVNSIEEIAPDKVLSSFIEQIEYPKNVMQADIILNLTDKLLKSTKLYKLKCNKEQSAGITSFEKIMKNN